MTQHTRFELKPDLVLDARRAVWLAAERTLVVADLHFGYVWAQRQNGQLLPLSASDDTAERLLDDLPCDLLIVKPPAFVSRVSPRSRGPQLVAISPIYGTV